MNLASCGKFLFPVLMGVLVLLCGCAKQETVLSLPRQELPGMRQQLLRKFDLPSGAKNRDVDYNGFIAVGNDTNYCYNVAILIMRFFDGDGKPCGFGGLPPTTVFREKAGFRYLSGGGGAPRSFSGRVRVPEKATSFEIGLSRYHNDLQVELRDFRCSVFGSALGDFLIRQVSWRNFGLLLVLGFALLACCRRDLCRSISNRVVESAAAIPRRMDIGWICLLLVMAFFFFVGVRMAEVGCDMPSHIRQAEGIGIQDVLCPLEFWKRHYYPMWHVLVKLVQSMFRLESAVSAAGVVNGLCYNACFLGIYVFLKRAFANVDRCGLIGMAVVVCMVGCMWGPGVCLERLYENTPNSWHNPTSWMVKPLALPCLLLAVRLLKDSARLDAPRRLPWPRILLLGSGLVLAELAKPSFFQVFLPALALFLAWRFLRDRRSLVPSLQISLVLLVPCLMMLAQSFLAFSHGGGGEGIGFGFMKVVGQYEHPWLNQLYGVTFPAAALAVTALRRKVRTEDVLCWTMLLIGETIRLLVFERGLRMMHGNFSWGYLAALYLVWIMAIRQYVELAVSKDVRCRWAFAGLSVPLLGHVLPGAWKMYQMMCLGAKY